MIAPSILSADFAWLARAAAAVEGADWVMLTEGVHDFLPGARVQVFVDPARVMVFSPDGQTVSI